jgi:hypothetical protein
LGDHVVVSAELELRVDPMLERRDTKLLEPRDLPHEPRLVSEVCKGSPTPETQSFGELGRSIASGQRLGLGNETLEPVEIDRVRIRPQHVSPRPGDQDVPADVLPQPRNVIVERCRGVGRRPAAPEILDQPVGADDLVGMQDQQGEHRPALRPAHLEEVAVGHHLERSEHPEFHPVIDGNTVSAAFKTVRAG